MSTNLKEETKSNEEIKTYIYDQRAMQSAVTLLHKLIDATGLEKCEIALSINKLLSAPIAEDVYTHTNQ